MIPIYWDLDLKQIDTIVKIRPLLYWAKLWTSIELEIYQNYLKEHLSYNVVHKI